MNSKKEGLNDEYLKSSCKIDHQKNIQRVWRLNRKQKKSMTAQMKEIQASKCNLQK